MESSAPHTHGRWGAWWGALDQGCLLNEANSLLFGSISCIQTSFLSLPGFFFLKSLKGVVVVVGEGGVGEWRRKCL